jgi:CRISPR-associated protein Cas1
VQYFSATGEYFGRISSTGHVNTKRQRLQLLFVDDETASLEICKRIISAKVNNQYQLVKRYARNSTVDVKDDVDAMTKAKQDARNARSKSSLLGYEGNAAKAYFSALSKLVYPEFKFDGRSRRPPKDPFNSMLSLGYTLLHSMIYGFLEGKGLNPYFGFLHKEKYNHPALASDLMEEWRSVIVDATVMSLVNGREIDISNFNSKESGRGVFIDKDGMKIFLKKLESKYQTNQAYLDYVENKATSQISYRRAIEQQVSMFSNMLEARDVELYKPIRIR